jgi:hypothetical protein
MPRKVLAANKIFSDGTNDGTTANDHSMSSYVTSMYTATENTTPVETSFQAPKQRRATFSTGPAECPRVSHDIETGSPSKRKEKSKSHQDLLQTHIVPVSELEAELEKGTILLTAFT